ncbi:hypothetical protein CDD80_5264 [Ophiocordyceps camponoti-rufipedis]|uniref:VIT domain-containing protein n=1 Tax=Ophiocordyceps camponoti-rufipedis TaxID=2004952 RepID=A0A2C5XUA9_9HYPO|nr:hypothetical protein CDD80_5264 [Ophiocordyceps camponoti-rufipedis]
MNRTLKTKRLASGVLFSPPADLNNWGDDIPVPQKRETSATIRPYYDHHHGPQTALAGTGGQQAPSNFVNFACSDNTGDTDWPPSTLGEHRDIFPIFARRSTLKGRAKQPLTDSNTFSIPKDPSRNTKYPPGTTLCLPLLSVAADVTVDGIVAMTELRQSFRNPSTINIPEARHTFPLYDGAVVTSFECTIGQDRFLRGVVKPKEQARKEFEKARAEKRETAALLEELTPEIFETSLGNIPPATTLEVKLTYVHELKAVTMAEEMTEGLAVTIPLSIAPRYGAPVSMPAPELPGNKLDLWIRVLDDGSVNPGGCHVESEHDTRYVGRQSARKPVASSLAELASLSEPSSVVKKPTMQFVWHYSSDSSVLKTDFVLVLQMAQGDRLRSRAVLAPADDSGLAALMIKLRPNDLFGSAVQPQKFEGEILFVLDRSSSMGWGNGSSKIDVLRGAMALALSGLPSTCVFNIISFGNEVRGLWHESQSAGDAANIQHARDHLPYIKADMGGTEVLLALRGAVEHRMESRSSTQVILITDGEVWDHLNYILDFVWQTRKELADKVRFFTLGIGHSVSHHLVEGIADLGGGYCDVVDVVKHPRWESRFNRMLRSAMEPDSWTCDVSLGSGYERKSLLECRFDEGQFKDKSEMPVFQAPYPLPPLHPYSYKSVFYLLRLENREPPSKVFVQTTTDGAKKKVYPLDVETASFNGGTIHHLAAKAVLLNLEDEVNRQTDSNSEMARLNAESLGARYSVASKWTSFVAVAEDMEAQIDLYKSPLQEMEVQQLLSLKDDEESNHSSSCLKDSHSSKIFRGLHAKIKPVGLVQDDDESDSDDGLFAKPIGPSHQATYLPVVPLQNAALMGSYQLGPATQVQSKQQDRVSQKPMLECPPSPVQIEPGQRVQNMNMSRPQRSSHGFYDDGQTLYPHAGSFEPLNSIEATSEPPRQMHQQSISGQVYDEITQIRTAQQQQAQQQQARQLKARMDMASMARMPPRNRQKSSTLPSPPAMMQRQLPNRQAATEPSGQTSLAQSNAEVASSSSSTGPNRITSAPESSLSAELRLPEFEFQPSFHDIIPPTKSEEPSAHQHPPKGPITCEDVIQCQTNEGFDLPPDVQARLGKHYCIGTDIRIRELLDPLSSSTINQETLNVLANTLMMICFFRTHLISEEDTWYLVIDNAERSVLQALGFKDDEEKKLEGVYYTLGQTLAHSNFLMSSRSRFRKQKGPPKTPAGARPRVCSVCDEEYDVHVTFVCWHDDCYRPPLLGGRRTWCSWDEFWDHQVSEGHFVCPGDEQAT